MKIGPPVSRAVNAHALRATVSLALSASTAWQMIDTRARECDRARRMRARPTQHLRAKPGC
jgi:phosphate-selective porin